METTKVLKFWGKEERNQIALWYNNLPKGNFTPAFQAQVKRMVMEVYKAELNKGYTVEYVDYDPYPDADTMRVDYRENKHLKISRLYNDAPIMPGNINLMFRFSHDCHHSQTEDCNFAFQGEICAYTKFARYAETRELQSWLFTEIVGQAAYRGTYGHFGEQKFAFAPLAWVKTVLDNYYVTLAK